MEPFGPQSRTGFELELLAPRGASRRTLADALAARVGGAVVHGFKHLSETIDARGRLVSCCELTPAHRVLTSDGSCAFTLVDDFSIQEGLELRTLPARGAWRMVMDDARLAGWVERTLWSGEQAPEVLLAPLLKVFSATLGGDGQGPRCKPGQRLVRDPKGLVLGVLAPYGSERERVCEVVTAPLGRDERQAALTQVLDTARALGFETPLQGGLHAHLDASPWQSTARLSKLILGYQQQRAALLKQLAPNPRSEGWRGPFTEAMLSLARSTAPTTPFASFAERLLEAGAAKRQDVNLLGVLRDMSAQPTLELRMFPLDWDAARVVSRLEQVERLLATFCDDAQ